jgi:alpha-1,6-mannosyltransferase
MKTLHLTNAWHEKSGGIATFYRQLIAAANREKHHIRLVVPDHADSIEEIGEFGRIYRLAAPPAPLNPAYRILYPSQFLSAHSKIQRIVSDERPDLVEVCDKYNLNYFGALLRLGLLPGLRYRPAVVGLTCERMDDNFGAYLGWGRTGESFSRFYMHWLYFPFSDYHIANSVHTAAELSFAAKGHAVSRGVWIRPMGVDTDCFSPSRRSEQRRLRLLHACDGDRDCALLLYAGRLAPEKNLDLLIDLMGQLNLMGPHFRLVIAGDGIERQRLKAIMESRFPGRVAFLGHLHEKQDLAELYASCDVFLHPNPREPFGIGPLEAMAAGIPLVVPNSGGVTSYANVTNAWTVEPTGSAFAHAILEALIDRPLCCLKIKEAIKTAAEYSWPRITSQYLQLYQEISHLHRGFSPSPGMEPAFSSTPAKKAQTWAIKGAASLAKSIFRFWAHLTQPGGSQTWSSTHYPQPGNHQ